jgi:nitrate/TMAO reductase-like tetraheme cytochrome c subunit
MNASPRTPGWYLITRHWLSLAGVALVITAAISLLFVSPAEVRGHAHNPYAGIVLLLIVPFIFFIGLALIPAGIYLSKREIRKGLAEATFDRKAALKRFGWFLGVTAVLNVVVGSQITYRAIKHMETPAFCGASCHTMKPEFSAFQNSPHSKVECVECHVAPGAAGWLASKTSGIRQLVETVLHTEPKPVPSALASGRLVPARETCENCHWPEKFAGVRLRVFSKYAEDETNTRSETVLLMLVGGDRISGIHGAHFGPGVHIRFAAEDPARQTIPWVEYRNEATREVRTYAASGSGDVPAARAKIDMQCIDCHNRPAHTFDLPERAMDKALAMGQIPVTLPFIKQKGVQFLKAEYRTSAEAADKLPAELTAFYRQQYPAIYARRAPDIEHAAKSVLAIYNRNVFPDLKVSWGTYPNNLGHIDFPGCFRCHDGSHSTTDGKSITQDCNTCHEPLAVEEASPGILTTLGIAERLAGLQKQ